MVVFWLFCNKTNFSGRLGVMLIFFHLIFYFITKTKKLDPSTSISPRQKWFIFQRKEVKPLHIHWKSKVSKDILFVDIYTLQIPIFFRYTVKLRCNYSFKGYGIRNSVNTQNWAEFIGQHKGIPRCITNGKGPSKFQNCRRLVILFF